jgi:hypothetical protein
MLAQNFKTPTDLGICDIEFESLITVLRMLERAEIDKGFRMTMWLAAGDADCETTACIAGWAYTVSKRAAFADIIESRGSQDPRKNPKLWGLLHPDYGTACQARQSHGAIALRNYLTHGEARWHEAFAE